MDNKYGIFHNIEKQEDTLLIKTYLCQGDGRTKMFPVKDDVDNFVGISCTYCEEGVDIKDLTLEESLQRESVSILFDNKKSLSNMIGLLQTIHDSWEEL